MTLASHCIDFVVYLYRFSHTRYDAYAVPTLKWLKIKDRENIVVSNLCTKSEKPNKNSYPKYRQRQKLIQHYDLA